ncbi:hypothetical protein A0J61_04168 [Choanephora cucurbitarum]|uniref:Uncharacterized protein n=1 Tax=Choanephora cucurbitarum TaxID=101091 RepID=A0A1C7NFF6_9FUNG|nr:hypothetical protein A0J61_04168 [Choanephora cucurbitarum]
MDTRHSQLVLISKRLESANQKIESIANELGWTRQALQQWIKDQPHVCPINKAHLVSDKEVHYRHCLLRSQGHVLTKKKRKSREQTIRAQLIRKL